MPVRNDHTEWTLDAIVLRFLNVTKNCTASTTTTKQRKQHYLWTCVHARIHTFQQNISLHFPLDLNILYCNRRAQAATTNDWRFSYSCLAFVSLASAYIDSFSCGVIRSYAQCAHQPVALNRRFGTYQTECKFLLKTDLRHTHKKHII